MKEKKMEEIGVGPWFKELDCGGKGRDGTTVSEWLMS